MYLDIIYLDLVSLDIIHLYLVYPDSESSSNNEEENNGKAWQNQIMKADDGTIFYLGENDVFHACNADGEEL